MTQTRPDWLTPGRSRQFHAYIGAFYAAEAVLSGHYYVAHPRAMQLIFEQADPQTIVGQMRRWNLNWLITQVGHGFPPEDEAPTERVVAAIAEEAHRHDIAVVAYLSLTNIYRDRFELLHPECVQWYAVDHQGKEVPYASGRYIPQQRAPRLMACLSSPGWRDYLFAKLDRVSTLGLDGIYYDNLFSTCFCPRCCEAYADFTEERVGERLEFQKLAVFDEASYRWTGAEVAEARKDASRWALLEDEFRLRQMTALLTDLLANFRERTGKSVFMCNAHNRPLLNDMATFILTEDSSEPGVLWSQGFARFQKRCGGFKGMGEQLPADQPYRIVTNAALYKHMAADGGYDKPWTTFHQPLRFLGDVNAPMTPESLRRSIAETHAFAGGYIIVPMHYCLWAIDNPPLMDAVEEYHGFLAQRRELWDAIYPISDTLVPVYSIAATERGMSELALENVPFEVVPVLQVDGALLSRFKTVIFLEEAAIRRIDRQALAGFVRQGGRVLLLGLSASLLPDLPADRISCLAEHSAEALVRDPAKAVSLSAKLHEMNGPAPWAVSAKRGLVCNLARNRDGTRLVLYAVNMWSDPVSDVQVAIRHALPGSPRITAYSPDGDGRPMELAATWAGDDTLSFVIPQVRIYTVVEIAR